MKGAEECFTWNIKFRAKPYGSESRAEIKLVTIKNKNIMNTSYNYVASAFISNIGIYSVGQGTTALLQGIGILLLGVAVLNIAIHHYRKFAYSSRRAVAAQGK